MPRKGRAARPSLTESFFDWYEKNREHLIKVLSQTENHLESWDVDVFESFAKGGRERKGLIRKAVSEAVYAAVFRTIELYQRRQEREQHLKRAQEARKLAAAIKNFLGGASKDTSAWGVRGDLKIFHSPQIKRYQTATGGTPSRSALTLNQKLDALAAGRPAEGKLAMETSTPSPGKDWEVILRAGLTLESALEEFAADRDDLDLPPGDGTDVLGLIFVENIRAAASKLFCEPMSARQVQLFALAAWRDMRLPLPAARSKQASEEAWMAKKFSAYQKLAPEKKRAIGY